MLVYIGIAVIVVGLSDFFLARLLTRRDTAPSGLGGAAKPPPAARLLKVMGTVTVAVGAVLIVAGLAT